MSEIERTSAEIEAALSLDPLAVAETLTGNSYKDDEVTSAIGFGLHMKHTQYKHQMLTELGDSTFSMNATDALVMFVDIGFDILLHEPFHVVDKYDEGPGRDEDFYILWKADEGLLLVMDTFMGKRNTATIYFNLRFDGPDKMWKIPMSSSPAAAENVRACSIDAREGVKFRLEQIRQAGELLPTWVEPPFLWLLHHGDTQNEGYDYVAINTERIAKLPQLVQDAIRGQK